MDKKGSYGEKRKRTKGRGRKEPFLSFCFKIKALEKVIPVK